MGLSDELTATAETVTVGSVEVTLPAVAPAECYFRALEANAFTVTPVTDEDGTARYVPIVDFSNVRGILAAFCDGDQLAEAFAQTDIDWDAVNDLVLAVVRRYLSPKVADEPDPTPGR